MRAWRAWVRACLEDLASLEADDEGGGVLDRKGDGGTALEVRRHRRLLCEQHLREDDRGAAMVSERGEAGVVVRFYHCLVPAPPLR
jgi:hypothetical protein